MILSHLRAYHCAEGSSKLPVPGPGLTVGMVAIKQGHKADDPENVWGALRDLGPRPQELHPGGHQGWNFQLPGGLWQFSELTMTEQVESERQTLADRGGWPFDRPAEKWTCCLTTSNKKWSLVSQLENKWEPGAGRLLNKWRCWLTFPSLTKGQHILEGQCVSIIHLETSMHLVGMPAQAAYLG